MTNGKTMPLIEVAGEKGSRSDSKIGSERRQGDTTDQILRLHMRGRVE